MLGIVESRDATLIYPRPFVHGNARLCIDLFPAIPSAHGQEHETFCEHFSLTETGEVPGLVTLRAEATLEQFVAFFGESWHEALRRWPTLVWMAEYRDRHGPDAYAGIVGWRQFYERLNDKIVPSKIALASIEHF